MLKYNIETDSFSDNGFSESYINHDMKDSEYSRYFFSNSTNKIKFIENLKKSPVELCVEITNHCNFSCPVCIASAGRTNKNYLSAERFAHVLAKLQNQVHRVCITGGEPLLHPTIEEFLSIVTKQYPTILSTNGYFSEYIEAFSKKYRNIIFAISLHGPKRIHDDFVNFNGAYEQALKSIKFALGNKALVHVYTIASKQNFNSIPELIKLLEGFPIKLHKVNTIKNKGRLNGKLKEIDLHSIITMCANSKLSRIQINTFPYYLLNSDGTLEVVNGYE